MMMPTIALILLATVYVNADRQTSSVRYSKRPRGQMGFKWTKQYSQKPVASGYGTAQPHSQYPYGKVPNGKGSNGLGNVSPSNTGEPRIASTESTEGVTVESTEGGYYFDSTMENTFEYDFMDCIHDTCAESYNACMNDEQCKEWMLEWQDTGSLNPECLQSLNVDASTLEPQIEKLDEEAIEPFATATSGSTTSTTSSTDNTYDTTYEHSSTSSSSSTSTESSYDDYDYDYGYGYDYDYDTTTSTSTSSTSTSDSAYDEGLFSSTEISGTDESEELECEYTELFWNLYDCGVANYCYSDQLKLAQSHQYIVQSPSNFRVTANVTGSKSSPNNWTIVIVALSSALGAIVMFEITRRLYKTFLNKAQCGYQCTTLRNSMRYLKNKWEQIRGYKYEKTHDDIDAIEESDDTGVYGIGSSSDKEDKIEIKNTDTLNSLENDSDISDDVELQRTADDVIDTIDTIDDQFVHETQLKVEQKEEEKEPELVDNDITEITVEPVQEQKES